MQNKNPGDVRVLANFIREFQKKGLLFLRLLESKEVSLWIKVIPAIALLYLLNPWDPPHFLIPVLQFLPGLNAADDIAVLLIGFKLFIELSPPSLVERLWDEIEYGISSNDNVVDAKYTSLDD